jgi:hypothetical protein
VCDVNGWSFVKGSKKFYDDAVDLLRGMILAHVAPNKLKLSNSMLRLDQVDDLSASGNDSRGLYSILRWTQLPNPNRRAHLYTPTWPAPQSLRHSVLVPLGDETSPGPNKFLSIQASLIAFTPQKLWKRQTVWRGVATCWTRSPCARL